MTKSITLDAADSQVTWEAAPNAKPVFTGGKAITGWDVRIVDEDENDCPPGVPGEFICRSNKMFVGTTGYYKKPEATLDEVLALMPAPDFPGGGQLISPPSDIRDAYASGRGTLRLRARWRIEDLARGQWRVIVEELPHGVSTAQVLSEIETLTNPQPKAGKKDVSQEQKNLKQVVLGVLESVRDESSEKAPVRIVLEPRSSRISQDEFMAVLLAHTSLQSSTSLNFTMIGRDWTHIGVAKLYTDIARNGYRIMYLTSRAIGQADSTRDYLKGIRQNGYQLPDGPVIMSPDRLIASLHREVILRKPEVFKMACLRDIARLFGADPRTAHSQPGGDLKGANGDAVESAEAGAGAEDSPSSGAATAAPAENGEAASVSDASSVRSGQLSPSLSSPTPATPARCSPASPTATASIA